ncbi:hypothetical protein [Bernardetia sp.]|uniref:hypothetical protein n=1 Tax=Bernardetia sp. TaxID=1937974 RepID=UPI0025C3C752|nr:hypothetical protein [Bernardetia sp.]
MATILEKSELLQRIKQDLEQTNVDISNLKRSIEKGKLAEFEKIMPPTDDVNVRVAQMYRVLSFYGNNGNEKPIWNELRNCFTPSATIINNTFGEPIRLSVDRFISLFRSQIQQNNFPPFYIRELNYNVEQFGNIAQRYGGFEICYYDKNIENKKGMASIQLLFIKEDWKISSMIWQEETRDFKIPSRFAL